MKIVKVSEEIKTNEKGKYNLNWLKRNLYYIKLLSYNNVSISKDHSDYITLYFYLLM